MAARTKRLRENAMSVFSGAPVPEKRRTVGEVARQYARDAERAGARAVSASTPDAVPVFGDRAWIKKRDDDARNARLAAEHARGDHKGELVLACMACVTGEATALGL